MVMHSLVTLPHKYSSQAVQNDEQVEQAVRRKDNLDWYSYNCLLFLQTFRQLPQFKAASEFLTAKQCKLTGIEDTLASRSETGNMHSSLPWSVQFN
jgi:hypothetical protein